MKLERILLIGSGDEAATPNTACLLSDQPCSECVAAHGNTVASVNRVQTSVVLTFDNNVSILCDCGYTFRDAITKMVQMGKTFPLISGFVATRTNALLGVDDIREVTVRNSVTVLNAPQPVIDKLYQQFPYVMPQKQVGENQKNLWTAHLNIQEPKMAQGQVIAIAKGTSPPPEMLIASRKTTATTSSPPASPALATTAAATSQQQHQNEKKPNFSSSSSTATVIDNNNNNNNKNKQVSEGVEAQCIALGSDASGFAISLSEDGKLKAGNPVFVYLPFASLLSQQQEHWWSTIEEECNRFRVELAVIGCPRGATEWKKTEQQVREFSEKVLNKPRKVVVACIPHTLHNIPKEALTPEVVVTATEEESSSTATTTTKVLAGIDSAILYDVSK